MRSEEILSLPINREVAEQLLRRDLVSAEKAVARYISIRLLQHQFDALVSFTFNLGSGALQRSTLRRKINSGYLEEAQEEFIKWVWASGRQLKGLISRRKAEAALFGGDLSDFLRFRNKTAILP